MSKVILFFGDSITDARRSYVEDEALPMIHYQGSGYATMVSAALGADAPYTYQCYNRGISGNRIVDLYARIKKDAINLKPDYMSILIGINGVWHEYSQKNGVSAEKFEMVYDLLIQELKQELPDLKIMIMEPFVLHGRSTCSSEICPGRWEHFSTEAPLRAAAAERIAEKHNLVFVPLQEMFDKAEATAPYEGYWLYDGVHPSAAGHELIKRAWLEGFEKLK